MPALGPRKGSLLVIIEVLLLCVNSLFVSACSSSLQGAAHPGRLIARVPADDSELSCTPVAPSSCSAALQHCHRGPPAPAAQQPPSLRPPSRALGRANEFSLAKGSVWLLGGVRAGLICMQLVIPSAAGCSDAFGCVPQAAPLSETFLHLHIQPCTKGTTLWFPGGATTITGYCSADIAHGWEGAAVMGCQV